MHYAFKAVSFGVSYHSPLWFQQCSWNRKDLSGVSHAMNFKMDLPQLVSVGAGVAVTKRTRIGVDARWFDYANTAGFSKVGYNADGSVAGFGWRSIWAVGGGVQQRVSTSTKVMVGYNYSGNPVPAQYTFFNTPAPAIVQHHVSGGIEQTFHKVDAILTYYHAFENSITGPWISGQGAIPGTSVTSKMRENSLTIGFAKSF
jgi:long-chain fatty acid transport protein